jgi:hypothetical protein
MRFDGDLLLWSWIMLSQLVNMIKFIQTENYKITLLNLVNFTYCYNWVIFFSLSLFLSDHIKRLPLYTLLDKTLKFFKTVDLWWLTDNWKHFLELFWRRIPTRVGSKKKIPKIFTDLREHFKKPVKYLNATFCAKFVENSISEAI